MPGAAPRAYDWRDALDAVRLIADAVSAPITVRNGVHTAFHPGRVAEVLDANGERIGFAGELHPKLLQELNLPERTCAFELDFSALFAHRVEVHQAVPVLTYPAATQDVALLVDRDLPASEVERVLREAPASCWRISACSTITAVPASMSRRSPWRSRCVSAHRIAL